MEKDFTSIDHKKLTEFTALALAKVGIKKQDAEIAAKLIVSADLRGIDTHGVAHLGPFYITRIQKGFINLNSDIKVLSSLPGTAVVDGDNGFGFLVAHKAMTEAIDRAKKCGIGAVAVRNSTHFGAASVYSSLAVDEGMIGISLSSTGALVFPPGATKRGMGTNPISIGVPAGEEAGFMLDMATSVVPGGKIGDALRRGLSIPLGWAVDGQGNPTTDPKAVFQGGGGLVPLGSSPEMGSYKGFGLGVAVEILCSILSGAVASLLMQEAPGAAGNKCDHFMAAIKIDSFIPLDQFKSKMDDLARAYHSLPVAEGKGPIALAGEKENGIVKERLAKGVPIHSKVLESLEQLNSSLGIGYSFS